MKWTKLLQQAILHSVIGLHLCLSFPAQATQEYRLYISPTPREANIKILNIKPKFHQGITLPIGRYDVQVSQTGYHPRRFWVDISNRSRRILVTLKPEKPIPAHLFIQTHPPQAQIKILNIKPVFQQGMSLAPGTYEIEVSYPQFATQRQQIKVENKDLQVEILLEVEEKVEQMLRQISTIPPQTPQKTMQTTEQPALKKYALFVDTEPTNAEVTLLNSRLAFQQGMLLPPGAYQLKIAKASYTSHVLWVEIQNQELRVKVRLSEPEYCFMQKQVLDHQIQQRQVRIRFYLDYVEAWYSTQILPTGALYQFRLLGQRTGENIDLVGTAYHEKETVELRSRMHLKDKQLTLYFDGQQQMLEQIKCSNL